MKNDTAGAKKYASDTGRNMRDIDANWWEFFSRYRLKQWQAELRKLEEETDISLEEVCDYLGLSYSGEIVFYSRLPRKKETFIGIGMAFGQPVRTINRWIGKYGMKRRLYAKDVCEDLIWIYLIGAAANDRESGKNYYRLFGPCAEAAYQTYQDLWSAHIDEGAGTVQLLSELQEVPYDEEFAGLREFIADHMDAFKTAYARPRRMLAGYVDMILANMQMGDAGAEKPPRSVLRGYLDDSMINYLSGDEETIHVLDRADGSLSPRMKSIPKGRRTHISLALALGMTADEVDEYLDLMGFLPLDAVNKEEGILINFLKKWEDAHPLQRKLKKNCLEGDGSIELTEEDRRFAAREMLLLRQDLNTEYAKAGMKCPYLNR